ncbi:MAG: hypothetical protein BMS9Abin37_1765 [Acidobacteriota bacterium]|nr:MAG: hypothetical protein BMS9Abin37_1765 [Acidobacteriota bacterium]
MALIVLLLLATATQDSAEHLFLSAARAGDVAEIRALLAAGADVDDADPDGRTALMLAAGGNDEALVELLLEAGADAGKRDAEGVSALTIAKAYGFPDIVARLRSAGARESREELLDEAVRAGDLDAVARLLDEGVDANALDTNDYQTPLMTALELRELEIFLRLVQAGADPTREGTGIKTSGENAISVAARQGSPWALRALLESRARQADLDGALMLGCANAAVVRVALEAGANVNAPGRRDETPLICAASAGSAEAVSALLDAGANVEATSEDGRTASDVAKLKGFDEIVALLAR